MKTNSIKFSSFIKAQKELKIISIWFSVSNKYQQVGADAEFRVMLEMGM
jgi:hypothetical protein